MAERSRPRLHFVLGKGGVGKSTVAAALALGSALRGERVLAIELGRPSGLARALGVTPKTAGRVVPGPSGVSVTYFDGAEALAEYLTRVVRLGPLLPRVLGHPLYRAFVGAAPGVQELMTIGKVRDELLLHQIDHAPCWDSVVVDAGASGHALELLRMPSAAASTFRSGRVHREAKRIQALISDPRLTSVHVVATAEQMPVAEAIESIRRLRELGLPVSAPIVNRCGRPAPTGTGNLLQRVAAFPQSAGRDGLVVAARHAFGWHRVQERYLKELVRGTALEPILLARLPPPLGPDELRTLSEELAAPPSPAKARFESPPQAGHCAGAEGTHRTSRSFPASPPNAKLVVCVGTGGVGKTTVSAAIALDGALDGQRALVLTIDPARALGRALGLNQLAGVAERVAEPVFRGAGLRPLGTLDAGMLDQKRAWDAFIARHAPNAAVLRAILHNPFYRALSQRFAGATEYVALEELVRLYESDQYDLIVLDTPPAAHALDFVRAPERIDRLLDPNVAGFLARPTLSAGRAAGSAVRFVIHGLERATGKKTLGEISGFFQALETFFEQIRERSQAARTLLRSPTTAFVLVTGPEAAELAATNELRSELGRLDLSLTMVVVNRIHPLPGEIDPERARAEASAIFAELRAAEPEAVQWLDAIHRAALKTACIERQRRIELERSLGSDVACVGVAELDHDLHSLADLAKVIGRS